MKTKSMLKSVQLFLRHRKAITAIVDDLEGAGILNDLTGESENRVKTSENETEKVKSEIATKNNSARVPPMPIQCLYNGLHNIVHPFKKHSDTIDTIELELTQTNTIKHQLNTEVKTEYARYKLQYKLLYNADLRAANKAKQPMKKFMLEKYGDKPPLKPLMYKRILEQQALQALYAGETPGAPPEEGLPVKEPEAIEEAPEPLVGSGKSPAPDGNPLAGTPLAPYSNLIEIAEVLAAGVLERFGNKGRGGEGNNNGEAW